MTETLGYVVESFAIQEPGTPDALAGSPWAYIITHSIVHQVGAEWLDVTDRYSGVFPTLCTYSLIIEENILYILVIDHDAIYGGTYGPTSLKPRESRQIRESTFVFFLTAAEADEHAQKIRCHRRLPLGTILPPA